MKAKIMSYMGGAFVPLPDQILKTLGWSVDDELKIEIVVNRNGVVSHLVVEKVNG